MATKKVFKKGDVCKTVNTAVNYGIADDTIVTVVQVCGDDTRFSIQVQSNSGQFINGLYPKNLKLAVQTKEELQKQFEELETEMVSQLSSIRSKIEFLDESGLEVYNENEYKVYKTLETLDSKTSKIDKAKIIAKLING